MPGPVQVSITVTRTDATKTFQVQVSPDVIDLRNNNNAAVPIQWNITAGSTPQWIFPSQPARGIDIKGQPADPPFQDDERISDTQYKWTRRSGKGDRREYRYSITVTNGSLTYVLDPTIINEP